MAQQVGAHMMISLDGFGAGENQSLDAPFGHVDPREIGRWMFEDGDSNRAEIDAIVSYGAYIMGRNMFAAPGPGDWAADWRGWWGEEPPYHAPVFVLTHHARAPLEMEGGTTFHFVTDGPEAALAMAREAAGNRDVGISGGVSTTRYYLNAGAIDHIHLSLVPILVHRGERLWDGLTARLEPTGARYTRFATHLDFRVLRKAPASGS